MKTEHNIPGRSGVYLLVIAVCRDIVVETRSRKFRINRGFYIYVGSARGPGGLRARINRHLRREKKLFWHIDYLLSNPNTEIVLIYYRIVEEKDDLESRIATILNNYLPGIKGFGCSDKTRDYSHLYWCGYSITSCINELIGILKDQI
ncbi:MAG: hypothetical protein B6U89_00365 [Desulfurococcales archaeon ex4484_58]|nr:MAG: hypothetical protein B6U89_00365 [Desulfurococcales archaeon ex4484_58]